MQESKLRKYAVSCANCKGPGQLAEGTFWDRKKATIKAHMAQYDNSRDDAIEALIYDIPLNVSATAEHIKWLDKNYFPHDTANIIRAYNAGHGPVLAYKRGRRKTLPDETVNYLANIIKLRFFIKGSPPASVSKVKCNPGYAAAFFIGENAPAPCSLSQKRSIDTRRIFY